MSWKFRTMPSKIMLRFVVYIQHSLDEKLICWKFSDAAQFILHKTKNHAFLLHSTIEVMQIMFVATHTETLVSK